MGQPTRVRLHRIDLNHSTLDRRSLKAFATTETELRLIANAATMGDKRSPNAGYNTPAASGTPRLL